MMDLIRFLIAFAFISAECSAHNISVIDEQLGSCTFNQNDTCGYNIQTPWEIHEGSYRFAGRTLLLHGGQDDDFYALFEPPRVSWNSDPLFSMASPLLPKGAACLSFYYTLPAATTTLHVITRTEDNVTVELWNVTRRSIRNWTVVDGIVLESNGAYTIEFVTKSSGNALAGVDNITVETFKCGPGYTPVMSEVLTYCSSARKTIPSCEHQACKQFQTFHHGTASISNTSYGPVATLTCHEGYVLNGSNIVECDRNGKWNHTGQYCELVECVPLPTPLHGEVSSSASVYGSAVTITCHTGYNLRGHATPICTSNGTWTSNNQTCSPVDCGAFTKPIYGFVTNNATTFGMIANITCHIGYKLQGSSISTCGSNGKWSNTGQLCTSVDCGPFPRPTKSLLSTGSTTYNSTVSITCFPGYKLYGSGASTCGENGIWLDAKQECILHTVFLKVPESNCTVVDNYVCICDNKSLLHDMVRNTTFNISTEMKDSFSPNKQGDFCIMMTKENSTTQSNISLITSTLLPGLYLISFFSDRDPQVTVKTESNAYNNLTFIERDHRWMNETVVLTADRQFRVAFRVNDTKDGHLGIENLQIMKACDSFNITHGHITVDHNTVYFSCDEGYRLVGNSSATCKQWTWSSNTPSCELIDCGRFPIPSNGYVLFTKTTYRSTAVITCHAGYILHGSNTSTCGNGGVWGSTGQTCSPVDCGPLNTPFHGSVVTAGTTYGSLATVKCHVGYTLQGNNTPTCSRYGNWSNIGQQCVLVDCGTFHLPKNSHLSHGPSTYNSTVIITCFPGYILSGSNTSTCGENGNWHNTGQECVLQTVFLEVPKEKCTFTDNNTCMCNNNSHVQSSDGNAAFDIRYEINDSFPFGDPGVSCYTGIWYNTSVQNNLSFTMTSPILQPGLYQINFQQLLSLGELSVTIETHTNKSNHLESFWKYVQRDKLWTNETIMLIQDKEFRIVVHANEAKNGLPGLDNIQLLKACDILNITNGLITVDHNTAYFRCNEGYRLVGNASATCTQWTWNSDAPSCELIYCATPVAPLNGQTTSSSTSYGSVSTVTCNLGYFVKGNETGVCGNNGNWTNENIPCLSIDSAMSSAVTYGCSDQEWNIRVNLMFLRSSFPNYKNELQIYLGIASCNGIERNGFLMYDNNFYACLTRRQMSANLNIFENQMVLIFKPQNSASSKAYNWTMNVHCNVVDDNIVSTVSTYDLHSTEKSISISVFSDPYFRMVLPSPLHVHTGDRLYVKVSSPILDPEIKLLLKLCYVRPALETDSRLDSLLIRNGCEVESSTHVISVAAHEIQFMFQNYAIVALREGTHVFCDVAYCNSQHLSENCIQTCNGLLGPVIIG